MADTKILSNAKSAKQDEFYTQLSDIELEMKHYRQHFKGKTVFCNCDDPYESNFFKYFAMNFNYLGLKKLIATCYVSSPVMYTQLSLFDDMEFSYPNPTKAKKKPYKVEITEVEDLTGNGAVDLDDIQLLLKNKKNVCTVLNGDGDFRSDECIELLKEADIVVTNPPFSLFREFVAQLVAYNKKFIIIGNQNAIHYKEIFPLIKDDKLWYGASIHSGDREFRIPEHYEVRSKSLRIDKFGNRYIRVVGVRWFTNLDYEQRHEKLILYKTYTPEEYPKYDNYDAINVNKTMDIPCDYDGIMGVPDTFLDKYNPEQFEILGCTQRGCHDLVPDTKKYDTYWEMKQDGTRTGSSGNKTNENGNLSINDGKHNYFINEDGHIIQSTYSRIFIRRKEQR
ncbi:MAG: adenine-specific methyltransferase EcoRI family protein [Clostridiales bacterium]|nr:adenine-specific methyltransferase EcoRI family protein [Clostridiales bacterium]